MSLSPNERLYEYQIVRTLGQGVFGTVYLAHDTLLDRPVAIKELAITRQTDEQAFKRFLQEARTAGGLNHPNIVTVHALKVEGPNVYLVMEYVSGGSLRGLLEKRSKLDIAQAVQIAIDVCEGLAAVHAKGIVHRDIKPENILLTEDGRAKVSDFGIAHVPRGAGGTSLTQAGFQPGTLVYMSPEQVLGKPVDAGNILKPALARGDLRCIGATTEDEYKQYIASDAALERRFQPIWVSEPSPEDTLAILRGVKVRYAEHHHVIIADDALEAAVRLSVAWLPGRRLPDKALDLLDEACSRARVPSVAAPGDVGLVVTGQTVAKVLAEWVNASVDELLSL